MSRTPAPEPSPTDLLGVWQLRRRLVDRSQGTARFGCVRGRLELTLVGSAVRWCESGQLWWEGRPYNVSRELAVVPEGAGWTVCFADGRTFHPWAPGRVIEHPCRADVYRGRIDVDASATTVRVLWDVVGPGKEQRIVTRCRRLPTVPCARVVSPAAAARSSWAPPP